MPTETARCSPARNLVNATLRRRSLLETTLCVALVAALAAQPAFGRGHKPKGPDVVRKATTVVHQATTASKRAVRDAGSGATLRQVALAAAAADAPAATADDQAAPPAPTVPSGVAAPEDGASGTQAPPPNPAPAEHAAPALAGDLLESLTVAPKRPAAPAPPPASGDANREAIQPNAPVVPSQVAGPAIATADAAAGDPPAGVRSKPVPRALAPSSAGDGRSPRHAGSSAQAQARGILTTNPRTGGTGPGSALSAPLRTPASAAIVPMVRAAGGVRTSRPPAVDNRSIPSLQRPSRIVSAVTSVVEVIPAAMWIALAGLGALVLLLGANSVFAAVRTRRLESQRARLMEDIGLLQAALLPAIPGRMGSLLTTVAYRPADGPAAGGDFYDAFALPDGRVGMLLGDVSGHGRQALAKTTLVRFTVRAHLEAGMSPREAISVAGRSLDGRLADDFSTVLAAIHDPAKGTLTYASAGHPPPIVLGPAAHAAITASSAPPIGVGFPTGQRQTVLPMPEGTTVAVYSDGLLEARIDDVPLGSERLTEWLADLGPEATAKELLDRVVQRADRVPDDLAAIVLHAAPGASAPAARVEQLKLDVLDIEGPDLTGFLQAAGISRSSRAMVGRKVSEQLAITGGVIVEVRAGEHPTVTVSPIGGRPGTASRQTAPIR
jgi:hypothetical protein